MAIGSGRLAAGGLLAAALLTASAGPARAGIALQFQGGGQAQSGFVPSDMGGAVGDGYVTQMVNGAVSVFDAGTGQLVQQTTLDGFWSNLGVSLNPAKGVYMSDPRVVFDPGTNRWFTDAVTTAAVNQVDVAVSKGADPAAGFTGLSFAARAGQFNDYPTLGVNHAAVTIGSNNFGAASGQFVNSAVFSIPKPDLTAPDPTLARMTRIDNLPITDFTNQPVTDLHGSGTSTTLLTSLNSASIAGFYGVGVLKLSNADSSRAALSTGSSFPNQGDVNGLINPVQPGGAPYQANDPRISASPVQVGGLIYFTNSVWYGGNDQVYWGVIDAASEQLLRSGVVGLAGLDLTYPSIAANGNGTFVIGFNGSGPSTDIGAYDVVCSEVTGACGTPAQLYAGTGSNYTGYGYQRWGDYSATISDPYNADAFWLFQDYVTSSNLWGTVITEINVPEPGSLPLLATALLGLAVIRRK